MSKSKSLRESEITATRIAKHLRDQPQLTVTHVRYDTLVVTGHVRQIEVTCRPNDRVYATDQTNDTCEHMPIHGSPIQRARQVAGMCSTCDL